MKKVHAPLKKAKQTSRWYLFKCLSYWVPTIWYLIKKALRLTSSAMYAGWYRAEKTYICQKIRLMPDVWFVLQDLLLGDHCCVDIMGATQFKTPRANWDKRCCSNPKGPVVELANDLSPQDAKKIDKQIERMPHLKQVLVWHALVLPLEKPFC